MLTKVLPKGFSSFWNHRLPGTLCADPHSLGFFMTRLDRDPNVDTSRPVRTGSIAAAVVAMALVAIFAVYAYDKGTGAFMAGASDNASPPIATPKDSPAAPANGPLDTTSGGESPASPQGDAPPGMQPKDGR
jgi:hypothetical protein